MTTTTWLEDRYILALCQMQDQNGPEALLLERFREAHPADLITRAVGGDAAAQIELHRRCGLSIF